MKSSHTMSFKSNEIIKFIRRGENDEEQNIFS